VKSCLNLGGPPSKPKYSSVTDSEEYREGKVKSTPMRGVKEILKPDAYKLWERACPVTAYLLYNGSAS
jgi:hypothetical protein